MELRHLRYFLALAEEAHFGRAAERLRIVQPALSMQIKALEEEMGGPLFLRTSRRVELTEAGRLLRTEAQRTLEQAEHTQISVQRAIRGETGVVRVGFSGNAVFSGSLMSDLRAFHRAYPDAELVVREMAPHQQVEALLSGQMDVGYSPDYAQAHHPALVCAPIGVWGRAVAMLADHPLAAKSPLTVAMLADEPLIFYAAHNADTHLHAVLSRIFGHAPHVAHRIDNTLSVLALAAAGLGLALVPAPMTQVALPGLVYRELNEPELAAPLILISRANESNGAVCAFLSTAQREACSGH